MGGKAPDAEEQPLLPPEPSHQGGSNVIPFYNSGPRERQDVGWLRAWLASVAVVLLAGVALALRGAPLGEFFKMVSPDYLADPASCPVDRAPGRRLLQSGDEADRVNFSALLAHPVGSVVGSLLGSVTLGGLFLVGFRRRSHFMVKAAIALQLAVPITATVVLAAQGMLVGALCALVVVALYVWVFLSWREQIELVSRLLGIAGAGLIDNPGLVAVGLVTPLVWGAATLLPASVAALLAATNGSVVPNSGRIGRPAPGEGGHLVCHDAQGQTIPCCTYQMDGVAIAYLAVLGVVVTWTSSLFAVIKMYTVSGATVQWYFTPASGSSGGGSSSGGVVSGPRREGRVMTSLRHALSASLGSLCAAAALLTVVQYMRQALDECEKRLANGRNEHPLALFVFYILSFVLRLLLSFVEFMTRFSIVFMAMTGQNFHDSAHSAVSLMKRNGLDSFGMWWLPPFILQNCALMMSAAFGGIVWAVSTCVWGVSGRDGSAIALGVSAGFLALLVISFFCSLLLNVLDAVFVCFAVDRDTARMTRQDVHLILKDVPGVVGQVVEQPGGEVAYGAPNAANAGRAMA